jgi:hypothetical protein
MHPVFRWLLAFILCLPVILFSEENTARIDTVQQVAPPPESGEVLLEEIEIKGRVDKPGVIILPRRIEPEVQEIDLDRSFQNEVKNGIGEIPGPDHMLRQLEQVESIKKAVEKERNKS